MAAVAIGTALVAGGAAVLNQVYERETDALMQRTRLRPLPDQRVTPEEARTFGTVLAAAGVVILSVSANALAALLALATLVVYLAIYTPMKRRSSLATLIGAVPGALPPLIGWTAAGGGLSRRLVAVRHRVPLADSALHGDRLALSRRLRARGFSACCRSWNRTAAAPASRRCSTRRRWCRSVSRRQSWASRAPRTSGPRSCSASACCGLPRASRVANRRDRPRPVLRLDHLPAAHLDGDVIGSPLIGFQLSAISYQLRPRAPMNLS